MVTGRHGEERRVLEEFELDEAKPEHANDWAFRMASLQRYTGADYATLSSIPVPESATDAGTRMLRASVLGELGKAATLENVPLAIRQLKTAFRESFLAVHRRGMVMTALRLADLFILQNDVKSASQWWVVANFGGGVGALPELGLHEVQAALEEGFGPTYLKARGAALFSEHQIAEILGIGDREPTADSSTQQDGTEDLL
jgi:hypothetical protein